ncbi:MAG: amino acid ABC transporter permease [Lachnospiraceae bacterium]|nr:amino acid ABC transporter permease [Lachnospiraceae bacterium]
MNNLTNALYLNFIKDNRYEYIFDGLKNTLIITFFATLLGIILGLVIAMIKIAHDNTKKFTVLNHICNLYITVIRGTPVVIQLMILFFCIFTSRNTNGVIVAIIGFGLNSGAYVAEIMRSGLQSIDKGQMEAGRSLGFNYLETMRYIIIPQAFKVILPSLCNEFIVLIKETSVAGYVAVQDLTKAGDVIRSRTYDAWTPLLMVAGIYLFLTCIFSYFTGKLEKRLKQSER